MRVESVVVRKKGDAWRVLLKCRDETGRRYMFDNVAETIEEAIKGAMEMAGIDG